MSNLEKCASYQKLSEVPVELSVQLGVVKLSISELLRLDSGDMLRVELHPDGIFSLTLENVLIGEVKLTIQDEEVFFEVVSVCEKNDSSEKQIPTTDDK